MIALTHYDVIRRPVITEKSTAASEHNKIIFLVAPSATKAQIKAAVEALFKVKVTKVNTLVRKGKNRRFRGDKPPENGDNRRDPTFIPGNPARDRLTQPHITDRRGGG